MAWLRSRGPYGAVMLGVLAGVWWLAWAGRHAPVTYTALSLLTSAGLTWLSVRMDERGNRRLLAGLAGVWLAAEAAVRVAGPRPEPEDIYRCPDPYLVFRGKPNVQARFFEPQPAGGSVQEAAVELNELGFRGALPSMPKRNEIRIIMLGGSAVFIGNPLSNSLAGHLERIFHERGRPEVRVYNWGVYSYVSGQELGLLSREAADFDPDLVIVYDGANDVVEPWVYEPRPGYPYKFFVYEEGLRRVGERARLRGLVASILWKSRALRAAYRPALEAETVNLHDLRAAAGYRTPAWEDRIVETYLHHVERMAVAARAFRFRLLVALQPVALFKESREPGERRHLGEPDFREHVFRTYGRLRAGLARLDEAGEASRAVAGEASRAARFLDFSRIFREERAAVFTDLIHITNDGNRRVAERLYDAARALLPQNRG